MDNYIEIESQNLIHILEGEEEFFNKFIKKYNIIWKTEDRINSILPISKSYVGYIITPNRKINLRPKYKEIGFEHIFRMYMFVYGYRSTDSPNILDVAETQNDIDVARLFIDNLKKNIKSGILQDYLRRDIENKKLKGKVNYKKTFINKITNKNRAVITSVSKLTVDILPNKLILTALKKLNKISEYRKTSSELLMYFEDVKGTISRGKAGELLKKINFNSNTSRYRQSLLYASMIIDQMDYDELGNSVGGESFLINFDRLFEIFVGKVLTKQAESKLYNIWSESNKYADILSNGICVDSREYLPDILYNYVSEDENYNYQKSAYAVLDVKNKAYGIFKNADVFQILTYARILNCKKTLLLYPSFHRKQPDELILNPELFDPYKITACYINIADNTGERFLYSINSFVKTVENVIDDVSIN